MIVDVATSALEAAQLGKPGKTLFAYHAPDNIKICILVIADLDGAERDEYIPGYLKENFKAIVRHPDYKLALTIANKVTKALDFHRQTVNGVYVQRMRATHTPIAFPIPDSDVVEVSVNLWACYVEP
jgi:hypothetical protein